MSVFIDKNMRVLTRGFTGKNGAYHSEQMIDYGAKIVGGVSLGLMRLRDLTAAYAGYYTYPV